MGLTKIEKMVGTWIGNEATSMETELPAETGLLDLSILLASRILRGFGAGADRFCYEVDPAFPALWECINETEEGAAFAEPAPGAALYATWDAAGPMHQEHRMVDDTAAWLEVREDGAKAKIGVRFSPEDTVSALAEVVSASAYHLLRCGARRVLIEVGRDYCLVMTPEEVSQEAVDQSFDEVDQPENVPLGSLVRAE